MIWLTRDADEFAHYNLVLSGNKPTKTHDYYTTVKQWNINNAQIFTAEEWEQIIQGPKLALGEGPILVSITVRRKINDRSATVK